MPTSTLALDETAILDAVRQMYEDVAMCPSKEYHFPTGRAACLYVGYPKPEIDRLPDTAVESFAGVGYPFGAGPIAPGDTVADIGSGSGVDVLIAATRTGKTGRVFGIDMTPAMIAKAKENIRAAGMSHAEILEGRAEKIPLEDASVDVVTSNGVLNLVPDKRKAFRELARVVRPGGKIQIADIVLAKPVGETSKANPQLWAECIVGAVPEQEYIDLARSAGFDDVEVIDRLDYFAKSANKDTRRSAGALGAHTIVISGRRT